jgi:putative FmdB family regulatory protein
VPTYTYACTGCGERIEAVQKFTDDPLTTCATCGAPLRKVFSAVGVVFKGSGFYRTDSRTANGHGSHDGDPSRGDSGGKKGHGKDSGSSSESSAKSDSSSGGSKDSGSSGSSGSGSSDSSSAKKDSSSKVA